MAEIQLQVQLPSGEVKVARFPNSTKQEAYAEAQAKGWKVFRDREVAAPPTTTTTTVPPPDTGQPTSRLGQLGQDVAIGGAQAGLPAAATALGLLAPRNRLGQMALGVLGGLEATRALKGKIGAGDVGSTLLGEALTPVGEKIAKFVRASDLGGLPRALQGAVPRAASRLGIDIQAAPRLLGRAESYLGQLAERALGPRGEQRELESVSKGVERGIRGETAIAGEPRVVLPESVATTHVQNEFLGMLRMIPDRPGQDALVREVQARTGVDLLAKADTMRGMILESPSKVTRAAAELAESAGRAANRTPEEIGQMTQQATQRVKRVWWSNTMGQALRTPTEELARGEGVVLAGRRGYIDGNAILTRLKQMGPEDKNVLGGLVTDFERVLDRASGAQRALDAITSGTGASGRALAQKAMHFPTKPFLAALTTGLGTGILGEEVGELVGLLGPHGKSGAAAVGGTAAIAALFAGRAGNRILGRVLGEFMTTNAGARWLAAGIDMEARKIPEEQIADVLMRALPHTLRNIGAESRSEPPPGFPASSRSSSQTATPTSPTKPPTTTATSTSTSTSTPNLPPMPGLQQGSAGGAFPQGSAGGAYPQGSAGGAMTP